MSFGADIYGCAKFLFEMLLLSYFKLILYIALARFLQSNASQILGFKFHYYQRLEVNSTVPFGLYQLTAILVKKKYIDLDSM